MSTPVYLPELKNAELVEQDQAVELVQLSLYIPDDLYYFQGHFPVAAIVPGVVQVHWVMEYLKRYFSLLPADYQSLDGLKFQQIIKPNYSIELDLKRLKAGKFSFSYHSAHGQHSSGKVVYG